MSSPNGIGGTNTVGYRYEGAKMHSRGRGYLGFARTVQTDYATNIVTVTNYYQKTATADDYLLAPTSKDFWITGNMYYRYQTHNNRYLNYEYNYWTTRASDANVVLPYVYRNYQYTYDFGSSLSRKTTDIPSGSIDAYGNVLKKVESTYDYTTSKTYTQTIDTTYYSADTINWRVGLVDTITATNAVPDEREGFAGSTITQINKTKFEYHPNSFLISNEITEPDELTTSNLRLTKSYLYDTYGNQTRVTVSGAGISPSRVTQTAYDFNYAYDKYKVVLTNALNHTEERYYDWRTGNMVAMIGPNRILSTNGFTTEWKYDGFGRKTKEVRVDGTVTDWSYRCINTDCSPTSSREVTFVTETASGKPAVTTYFDQLSRKVRTVAGGFNNSIVQKQVMYDSVGRVKGETNNYYTSPVAGTPYWTCYDYNEISRVTRQTLPSTLNCNSTGLSTFKSLAYSLFRTTETIYNNGNNGASTQTSMQRKNALGQLVEIQDAALNYTYYRYNALGKLVEVKDALGNLIKTEFDKLGRKTRMDDPDMGVWYYEYNAAGELTRQQDAKAQVVNMTYDALGRIKTRSEPGASTTTWNYDTATYGKGKLASVSNNTSGYARTHNYDAYGRPSWVQTQVLFENFRMDTSYDQYGRVSTTTYPSSGSTRFAVQNCYDSNGYLKEVRAPGTCFTSGTVYWKANGVNASGKVTNETLGNGVSSAYIYDDMWGYLTDISAGSGTTLQSSKFIYDRLGNLEKRLFSSRSGINPDVSETFTYDSLNRLRSATTSGPFVPSPLTKTYNFNAIGNITAKSDYGNDYRYGTRISVDGAGPHAVREVYNLGTLRASYIYDANGNMTSGAGRTISYTWFNQPYTVSSGSNYSTFSYDSEHMRVMQTSNKGTTVYVNPRIDTGGHYEREIESGVTTHKHYIYGGTGVVAVHEIKQNGSPATQTKYFLKDHLGSIEVVLDQSGGQLERLSYDAFGKRRNVTGSDGTIVAASTHHGFTGHEHLDNVSLINMNGRLYDPTLGRFTSADPYVKFAGSTQGFNRYSYTDNNPLSRVDMDGYGWLSKQWKKYKKTITTIAVVALAAYTGGLAYNAAYWATAANSASLTAMSVAGGAAAGAASGALIGAASGYAATGTLKGALSGAALGGITGGIGGAAGGYFGNGLIGRALNGGLNGAMQTGSIEGFARGMVAGAIPSDLGLTDAYMNNAWGNAGINVVRDGIRGAIVDGEQGAKRAIAWGLGNNMFGHLHGMLFSNGSSPRFSQGAWHYVVDNIIGGPPAITFGNVISYDADMMLLISNHWSNWGALNAIPSYADSTRMHELEHVYAQSSLNASYLPLHAISQWSGSYFLETGPYMPNYGYGAYW
ncbi:MAG: hypothetical protein L0Z73_01500 [Gammaproteobacteria bacterium]|nr:hypothetical protein [Gammaproteobacteria bacterium]